MCISNIIKDFDGTDPNIQQGVTWCIKLPVQNLNAKICLVFILFDDKMLIMKSNGNAV